MPPRIGVLRVWADVIVEEAHGEGVRAAVSQWRPRDEMTAFDAFDASRTAGMETRGYFGAVFDGRYVYFVPMGRPTDREHGTVLRYDTHSRFDDPASYAAHDASRTAGLSTKGYYGGVFDGRFVYFVPRRCDGATQSRLLRLDTASDFHDPA